jgi:hypothetical protein
MRVFWIPMGGTIAAVIAVAVARGERDDTPYPILVEPAARPAPVDLDGDAPEEEPGAEVEAKTPQVHKYLMEVREDGTFGVTAFVRGKELPENRKVDFKSIDEFLASAAPEGGPRPAVHLFSTTEKVSDEDLEKVAASLRERCEVVIQPQ